MRVAALCVAVCLGLASVGLDAAAAAASTPAADAVPDNASPAVDAIPQAPAANLVRIVENGDRAKAIELIKAHTDVRVRDVDGTTALHWAAHQSDAELARLLIAAGADVRAMNDYGASPMSAAAENGDAAGA